MFAEPEFWVFVAFVIFVAAVWKPASRAIVGLLDDRRAKIKAQLDEAARLREEAQTLLATYQRKQRSALKEAEEILDHARSEAERMHTEAAAQLEAALQRREKLAMERIAQAEAQALHEVRNTAVDLALSATRTLVAQHLVGEKANAMINDAIAELPQRLH